MFPTIVFAVTNTIPPLRVPEALRVPSSGDEKQQQQRDRFREDKERYTHLVPAVNVLRLTRCILRRGDQGRCAYLVPMAKILRSSHNRRHGG